MSLESNIASFKQFYENDSWRNKNLNKFAAFVDGQFLGTSENQDELISHLELTYPGKFILVKEVTLEEDISIIEISPFFLSLK